MKKRSIMGIYNATPDSLFAGNTEGERIESLLVALLEHGADIIDIGGESTAPNSPFIDSETEWERIRPVLEIAQKLKQRHSFSISVDTYKASVFEKALSLGADMLNDITALRGDPEMIHVLEKSSCGICVMYSSSTVGGEKRTSNEIVAYDDVIKTICDFFTERISFLTTHGIAKERIILDPGMGAFVSGDPRYSFEILYRLSEIKELFPSHRILIGASRKSFTGLRGEKSPLPVTERMIPSVIAHAIAARNGADILRVHDVKETVQAIDFLGRFEDAVESNM